MILLEAALAAEAAMRKRETTYLVTSVTQGRRAIFQTQENADILCAAIAGCRDLGMYQLHAFVVMPDHFHALITPASNRSLEQCLQRIKGGSSHDLGRGVIWQRGFNQQGILDAAGYDACVRYIVANPERRGLADWLSVSSRMAIDLDPLPEYLRG